MEEQKSLRYRICTLQETYETSLLNCLVIPCFDRGYVDCLMLRMKDAVVAGFLNCVLTSNVHHCEIVSKEPNITALLKRNAQPAI
jgi:hypothetical protein